MSISGGYPYFLQELGYAVWTVSDGPLITMDDILAAVPAYEAKLDQSFFRVRLDRATELQRAYLRAMAQLGPATAEGLRRGRRHGSEFHQPWSHARGTDQHGPALYARTWIRGVYGSGIEEFLLRAIPELQVPPLRRRNR